MAGDPHPAEQIGGLASTSNVSKTDMVAYLKGRSALVCPNPSDVQSRDLDGQTLIYVLSTGAFYQLDTGTLDPDDDGVTLIRDAEDNAFTRIAGGTPAAEDVPYDNAGSGLDAENVQDALDELASGAGGITDIVQDTTPQLGGDLDLNGHVITGMEKDTDGTLAANSDSKIPSQKAVKTYADTKLPTSYLDTDGTLAANSDSKIASQKATKTYADTKLAKASNLSDVANAATAFGNIKQAASDTATGVVELATDAETVTGSDTQRAVTPANLVAKMAAPGAIGGTTPSTAVFTTMAAKNGKPWVDVMAYGADPTGVSDSTTAFNNAIAAAQAVATVSAATVFVPPGQYLLQSGITIPTKVRLLGAGIGSTILFAWFHDVTVVTLNGQYAAIENFQIFGKGTNSDSSSFGASNTTYALYVQSATDGHVRNVKVSGGYHALAVTSTDCSFYDVIAITAYGPSLVLINGANWFVRCKFDHTTTTTYGARPWSARANTTAYSVGDTRTATGPDGNTWGIVCTSAGTSGGSAPTLLNFGRNITDGTVVWRLVARVTYSGVYFNGSTVGENSFYQVDLSGPYEYSIRLDESGAGNSLVWFTNAICSAPVYIKDGNQIGISQSELTGVTVDTAYAGRFFLHHNVGVGTAWNVDVGANVNNFAIIGNDLATGTLTIAAGTSNNYAIAGNIRYTLSDGGTGTTKTIANQNLSSAGNPQFNTIELGHASDTTISRDAAGSAAIEGNKILSLKSAQISAVTGKTTPVDADVLLIEDSAASNAKKSLTWANVKATLKSYFDTLYASLAGAVFTGAIQTTTIEVGHASDTTLSRASAGVVAVEGVNLNPNIPISSKSAAYTTVLGDANTAIYHPSSDNNARTFTIDSNANVAYPVGTTLVFINEINTVTIAITSDTLTLAGVGSTGSRTLAANGMATAIKVASTKWVISGTGLT